MKPMIDPARDLKGATPEKLVKALFRPVSPRHGRKPIVRRKISVKQVSANHSGNR